MSETRAFRLYSTASGVQTGLESLRTFHLAAIAGTTALSYMVSVEISGRWSRVSYSVPTLTIFGITVESLESAMPPTCWLPSMSRLQSNHAHRIWTRECGADHAAHAPWSLGCHSM